MMVPAAGSAAASAPGGLAHDRAPLPQPAGWPLEITERGNLTDSADETPTRLHQIGAIISRRSELGTPRVSSLRRLPVEEIKIDSPLGSR